MCSFFGLHYSASRFVGFCFSLTNFFNHSKYPCHIVIILVSKKCLVKYVSWHFLILIVSTKTLSKLVINSSTTFFILIYSRLSMLVKSFILLISENHIIAIILSPIEQNKRQHTRQHVAQLNGIIDMYAITP